MQEPGEIDSVDTQVYRGRVIHPTDSVEHLAKRLGLTPEQVAAAETKLSALGLIRTSPGGGWVAISPESAADELLGPAEQDILQKRIAMAATRARLHSLTGDYLEARSMRSTRSNIEITEGLGSIRAVIDDLARTSSRSIDVFILGALTDAGLSSAERLDLEALARGVSLRIMLQHSARKKPRAAQYAATITAAGAQVRTITSLPSRLLIYDRDCAVLPLDPDAPSAGVALVRDTAVLSFVQRLFDHYWERALVFTEAEPDSGPAPTGVDREVLLLMASGKKNETIAHQLGMSVRSVSRIVSALLQRLDADSRFQAGVRAAQNGWLS